MQRLLLPGRLRRAGESEVKRPAVVFTEAVLSGLLIVHALWEGQTADWLLFLTAEACACVLAASVLSGACGKPPQPEPPGRAGRLRPVCLPASAKDSRSTAARACSYGAAGRALPRGCRAGRQAAAASMARCRFAPLGARSPSPPPFSARQGVL